MLIQPIRISSLDDMSTPTPDHHVDWHPIGQTSNQLILYHPPSHALSVRPHPAVTAPGPSVPAQPGRLLLPYDNDTLPTPLGAVGHSICPYCSQPIPSTPLGNIPPRAPTGGYFEILEQAHEASRPPSPRLREKSATPTPSRDARHSSAQEEDEDGAALPARGYYERFFREEGPLGSGAEGSVFLATHVIGGNVLGTYAVKKIAVGTSKEYLVRMLREVRLLEALRHPNIITYHHSWIDMTHFSSFGPPIMALHVLMMYATAGNLDTFLLTRSHSHQSSRPDLSAGGLADSESLGQLPKAERIKAFKKRRQSGGNIKREENRGVLLLGLEELASLFRDVVEGLAFLHANSILHLDLKCSNVLLHWQEGKLIPKALISDFGTSEEMLRGKRERTGHTGTMEYMAPETLVTDAHGQWRPSDSHADMWSLGMILHKLLFLHLPYPDTDNYDVLQAAILAYPGFVPTAEIFRSCERRHIPRDILLLLAKLVDIHPESRPSAEKVKMGLRKLDTRAPFGSFSGIMTRFARPFEFMKASSEDVEEEPRPELSPVRPILALPSPAVELRPTPVLPEGTASKWSPHQRHIKAALFVIKIMSLQPSLTGIQPSPIIAVTLTLASVIALSTDTWGAELASSLVHIAVVVAVGRSRSHINDPIPTLSTT